MNRNDLFPIGFFGMAFLNTIFTQWIVYYHAPPDQSSNYVGTVLLVGFLLQGLMNPFIGMWADRLQHPWGKRRPFILLGLFPLIIVFFSIWVTKNPIISTILILLYGQLFMTVSQPYTSLLPNLAPTQNIRLRYSMVGIILAILSAGIALICGPYWIQGDAFYKLGLIGGLIIFFTMGIPAFFFREGEYPPYQERPPVFKEMALVLKRPAIKFYVVGIGTLMVGVNSLTVLSPYIAEAILQKERTYTSVLNSFIFVGIILTLIFVALMGKKISFFKLIGYSSLLSALALGIMGWNSFSGQISLPIWWVGFVAVGFMVLAAMIAPPLILAQFADDDGKGRDGLFFGLNGLGVHFGNATSSQLTVLLLSYGNSPDNPIGVQWVVMVSMGFIFSAFICFLMAEKYHKKTHGAKNR